VWQSFFYILFSLFQFVICSLDQLPQHATDRGTHVIGQDPTPVMTDLIQGNCNFLEPGIREFNFQYFVSFLKYIFLNVFMGRKWIKLIVNWAIEYVNQNHHVQKLYSPNK
jgi:hypothetical protein